MSSVDRKAVNLSFRPGHETQLSMSWGQISQWGSF